MNRICLTFDYELFFGAKTGSVARCMTEPTQRLAELARRHKVAFTFFVDASMLIAMKREGAGDAQLMADYSAIARQIGMLRRDGHSIQLHIHPHWEDSRYIDGAWRLNVNRYRLDQFSDDDIYRIVGASKAELEQLSGSTVHAFRAGGLCIQPFSRIGPALRAHGIRVDSSLYRGGQTSTATHQFDYRDIPAQSSWRFENDPGIATEKGYFTEYPITPAYYPPLFFAGMALSRIRQAPYYKASGDGAGLVGRDARKLASVFLKGSHDMASIDGYRARRLHQIFNTFNARHDNEYFVAIGHPKALSDCSFRVIDGLAVLHAAAFSCL